MIYAKTTEKLVSENYPYGYTLKTTKTDWIEFNKKHGFRHVSQTVNPKTGRLNKPKAGTYNEIMLLGKNEENGHTQSRGFSFYNHKDVDEVISFFSDPANFDLFTPEQREFIYMRFLIHCKADMSAQCTYCGTKPDDIFPLYEQQVKIIVQGIKEKGEKNFFPQIKFDWEKIDALKVEGYNPFKVTSYGE